MTDVKSCWKRRSLGQNFVTDDKVLAKIVSLVEVAPGTPVLELGPGTGNLTKHLLEAGAKLTVIEKDDRLYQKLCDDYGDVRSSPAENSWNCLTLRFQQLLHQSYCKWA